MLYAILCTFRPGAFAQARELRLEHYDFLRHVKNTILEGGPLLDRDGVPAAMLVVVERGTLEEAESFISAEPYTRSGLFESVLVRRWSHVLPEPSPDFVESEYQKEVAARNSTGVQHDP